MSTPDQRFNAAHEEIAEFERRIAPHREALTQAICTIGLTLQELAREEGTTPPPTLRVHAALFAALGDQLHGILIVADRACPGPAATLAASAYEIAFTIAYIGTTEDRVCKWIEWDDPLRSVWSVPEMVQEVAAQLASVRDGDQVSRVYRHYSQLCAIKHANPRFVPGLSFIEHEDSISVEIGSKWSTDAERVLLFAIEQGIGLAHVALWGLINAHVIDSSDELIERANVIGAQWQRLHDDSVARWGSEDPMPGKWRSFSRSPASRSESR